MSLLHIHVSWQVSQQWFNPFPSGGTGAEHSTAMVWTPGGGAGEPCCQSRHLSLFSCCVSLLSHANKNVSTFQCLGTSCRCVSDAQLNKWSKLETQTSSTSILSFHPMEQNRLNRNRGTLELGLKGNPSLLWPVKLITRHYYWSQKVEGIQKKNDLFTKRKCKCLVISQKIWKTKYKPSCFRWLPNLNITG